MPDVDLSVYDLAEWDGACLDLVDDLLHKHEDGGILYVENITGIWSYHAALVLDGLVYDPWFPTVRKSPAEYVNEVFGPDATWEINPGADEL